jgi:hypothetical protein
MDITKSSSYVYPPLQQPTAIRIAIIEPSMDPDAPLRFSFHQACIEDLEGRYEAVSYVWGAPNLCFPVYNGADGSHLLITENLNHVLWRLRNRLDPRWLWADAICIDQKNDHEKAVQIPLMVQIFRGATRVVAWLQDSDEAIERAMRYIDHVSRRLLVSQLQMEEHDDDDTDNSNTDDTNNDMDDHVADILTFFNLPYFRRLWILQEVAMSMDITFICGKTRLSWFRLYSVLQSDQYKRLAESSQSDFAGIRAARLTADAWSANCLIGQKRSTMAGRKHIFDLVSASSMYQCTDARDRIFALYSLANHRTAHMKIDYSLDVYDTYRNFALACMADGRTHEILDAALARLDSTSTRWPSWVPDWQCNATISSLPRPKGFENATKLPVVYTGNVYEDVVELKIKCLRTHEEDHHSQPLRIHMEGMVLMQESALVFLRDIINLCRISGVEFLPGNSTLSGILRILWLSKSPTYARQSQLNHLIHKLWNGKYTECNEQVKEYEQPLLDHIAAIAHGHSCFVAKFKGNNIPYICYGRTVFVEGDILIALDGFFGSADHGMLRMCVLRPIVRPVEQNPLTPHQTYWTAARYRIVGEALLFYPYQATETYMATVRLPSFNDELLYLC